MPCKGARRTRPSGSRPVRALPKIQCHYSRAVPSGTRDTHNKRVLWKTRTTRNFAGLPAFRHILGIGRWCIAHVLKAPDIRPFVPQHGRNGPDRSSPGLLFFRRVMTVRIISILAAAITIGPSLANGSPACMTESEARAKFPKATHLYMREHCWSDSAVAPVHSRRQPSHAAAPAPSPLPALAAMPALSPRPEIVNTGTDAGAQCQYSPCE
jgi:hypothetical protein